MHALMNPIPRAGAQGGAGTIYERIGSEAGVRRLVQAFYDLIETHPAGEPVKLLQLRGHGIAHARIDQVNFLSGFFGGPKLYAEKYGHSNVRQIHEHVEIDEAARDSWLACMDMALDQVGAEPALKQEIMHSFTVISNLLVNY